MSFFTIREYDSQIMPEKITPGNSACYADMDKSKWAYIRLDSDTKLSFGKGTGSCPLVFPSDNVEEWGR